MDKTTPAKSEAVPEKKEVREANIRQNLIDLAVKFLNNSRVTSRPMEEKKGFLRKKGLSDTEIDKAVSIAKQLQPLTPPTPSGATSASTPPLPPPRSVVPYHHQQQTRSRTWSEYAIIAVLVGGASYAVVQFVRNYVVPWFNSPRVQEQKLEDIRASIEQLQSTVSETMASLNETNRSIQALLSEQQQHIQVLTSQVTGLHDMLTQRANDQSTKQLKDEISSLKGILLSRHQFPPTPTRGGVANGGGGIPGWQRSADLTPVKTAAQEQHSAKGSPITTTNGDSSEVTVNGVASEVQQSGNGIFKQNEDETDSKDNFLQDDG